MIETFSKLMLRTILRLFSILAFFITSFNFCAAQTLENSSVWNRNLVLEKEIEIYLGGFLKTGTFAVYVNSIEGPSVAKTTNPDETVKLELPGLINFVGIPENPPAELPNTSKRLISLYLDQTFTEGEVEFAVTMTREITGLRGENNDSIFVKLITFPIIAADSTIPESSAFDTLGSSDNTPITASPGLPAAPQPAAASDNKGLNLEKKDIYAIGIAILVLIVLLTAVILLIMWVQKRSFRDLLKLVKKNEYSEPDKTLAKTAALSALRKSTQPEISPKKSEGMSENEKSDEYSALKNLISIEALSNTEVVVDLLSRELTGATGASRTVTTSLMQIDKNTSDTIVNKLDPSLKAKIMEHNMDEDLLDQEKALPAMRQFKKILDEHKKERQGILNNSFHLVETLSDNEILHILEEERPKMIAIFLTQINPTRSKKILTQLPSDIRAEVLVSLTDLKDINPEAFKQISLHFGQKTFELAKLRGLPINGIQIATEIINELDELAQKDLLSSLAMVNPEKAVEISKRIIIFSKLIEFSNSDLAKAWQDIETETFIHALRNMEEDFIDHILKSRNAREGKLIRSELQENEGIHEAAIMNARKILISKVKTYKESNPWLNL